MTLAPGHSDSWCRLCGDSFGVAPKPKLKPWNCRCGVLILGDRCSKCKTKRPKES